MVTLSGMAGPLFPASLLQDSWIEVGPLVVLNDEVGVSAVRAGGVDAVLIGDGLQDCAALVFGQ